MYCMKCGAEIAAETKFCGKCGASQSVVESAAVVSNANADKPNRLLSMKVNKKIIFLVVALVMISPWIFLPSSKSKDSVQFTPNSTSQQKEAAVAPAVPAASLSIVPTKSNSADSTLNLAQDFANELGPQTAVTCLNIHLSIIKELTEIINIGLRQGLDKSDAKNTREHYFNTATVYSGLVKLLPNTDPYIGPTLAWIQSSSGDTMLEFEKLNCQGGKALHLYELGFK